MHVCVCVLACTILCVIFHIYLELHCSLILSQQVLFPFVYDFIARLREDSSFNCNTVSSTRISSLLGSFWATKKQQQNPKFYFVDTEVKSPVFAGSIRNFCWFFCFCFCFLFFVSSVLHRVDISRLHRADMVDTLLRVTLLISRYSLSSVLLTMS